MSNDMPIGFAMSLVQNKNALATYVNLSNSEKEEINIYIQNSKTGLEAKERIDNILIKLSNNSF
ncbi:MAG: hypothetical protein PHR25_06385 [Clostridia bacterium]|nr:hypothetical protein [Clostridia bacterium]